MQVERQLRARRGVVNIWIILFLFLMVGLVGWACDTGFSALVLNQLQAAADAAALAGAAKVKTNQDLARTQAQTIALANRAARDPLHIDLNTGNGAGGDIVVGIYDKLNNTFTPSTNGPNAVQVVANRTNSGVDGAVNLIFGPVFGANTVELSAKAIAVSAGVSNAAIIVLHPNDECALRLQGNPTLNVTGGAVQVNSNHINAACGGGSMSISAPELNVVGSTNVALTNGGTVNTGSLYIPDPLASLPAPPDGPIQPNVPNSGDFTIQPGYYPNGINRNGDTHLVMQPGIYVLNEEFRLNGNASITGHEVLIYMKGGGVAWNGGGEIDVDPITTGTYAGVTIFQARNNSSDSFISGDSGSNILGTLYFPGPPVSYPPPSGSMPESPNLTITGNAASFGNQIIAWHMELQGNANINIPYNGAFPPGVGVVYLVQ